MNKQTFEYFRENGADLTQFIFTELNRGYKPSKELILQLIDTFIYSEVNPDNIEELEKADSIDAEAIYNMIV